MKLPESYWTYYELTFESEFYQDVHDCTEPLSVYEFAENFVEDDKRKEFIFLLGNDTSWTYSIQPFHVYIKQDAE